VTPEALLDLFVLSPVGLVEVDEDGRVEVANLAARSLLAPFTRTGSLDDLWLALADAAPELAARARSFDAPRGVVIERLELLATTERRGVVLSLVKTAPRRFVVVAADAGDLAGARDDLLRIHQQLRAVESAVANYAIYTVDAAGRIASWSESAARVHQFSAEDVVGQQLAIVLPPSVDASHAEEMLGHAAQNGWAEEDGQRRRADGTVFPASTMITALRDAAGITSGYSVVTHDLSEQQRMESAMRDDASSTADFLTGVASQRAFLGVATSEVARARRYSQPLSLLLVDPDHFRELSQRHGDEFAKECLRAIATACRHQSRNTDVVGRVGGEQFAVLLPSTDLAGGLVLAERIRERMHRHVYSGELASVRSTLCIGVAELSETEASVERLLAQAATAVERAQTSGRNLVVGYD
jgi:diguanylate cyclase (GGDEF)-like protein/PAS domain S-box-containing protein